MFGGDDDAVVRREAERLAALRRYDVLDTPDEAAFDRIVRLARAMFGTPIAEVSLIDERRQWLKARDPDGPREAPREWSFCAHAIRGNGIMVVPDARADERVAASPFVTGEPHIRFYAGAPLRTPDGHSLGTLCIVSPEPRAGFGAREREQLQALADVVVSELELRRRRREEGQFLNRLLEHSADCIKVLGLDGGLLSMNEAARVLLEVDDPRACVGRPWPGFWPAEAQAALRAALDEARAGRTGRFEGQAATLKGALKWWDVTVTPILGAAGRPERLLAISRDVTERKRAEAALAAREAELRRLNETLESRVREEIAAREEAQTRLAHARRMEALGQLAGGIAHDFNNVMQAVQGGAGLIRRRASDPRAVDHLAGMVEQAAGRGAAVTRRLLAFARRGELRTEAVDPAALLAGLQEVLEHTLGAGIAVRVEDSAGSGGPPPLLADKGQLEAVLVNLAANARDAMPGGGTLALSAAEEAVAPDGPAHPAALVAGRYVRLSVSDTGEGMTPQVLARASEPFFTTKPQGKGTGLGLAMARGFAEQLGGGFAIRSTQGAGTTVTLWLPVAAAGKAEPAGGCGAAGASPPAQTSRVLLVDDEEPVRAVLAEGLQECGYTVRCAGGAQAALAVLEAGAEVDVLLTDYAMPGMDGLTLIGQARCRRPGLAAVLLTGNVSGEVEARLALDGMAGGAFSLLRKPVAADELAARIGAMLERARRARPPASGTVQNGTAQSGTAQSDAEQGIPPR